MEGGDSKMKVTNLCVLKDTWMAKNSGVPSLNILSETFSHRCSLGSSAHAENVLGNPNPIRLEGQPCSALLTGGGRSFAWFPLLSVALQGLCFRRSLFWLIFTARYVLSSPNIWILALLKVWHIPWSLWRRLFRPVYVSCNGLVELFVSWAWCSGLEFIPSL